MAQQASRRRVTLYNRGHDSYRAIIATNGVIGTRAFARAKADLCGCAPGACDCYQQVGVPGMIYKGMPTSFQALEDGTVIVPRFRPA